MVNFDFFFLCTCLQYFPFSLVSDEGADWNIHFYLITEWIILLLPRHGKMLRTKGGNKGLENNCRNKIVRMKKKSWNGWPKTSPNEEGLSYVIIVKLLTFNDKQTISPLESLQRFFFSYKSTKQIIHSEPFLLSLSYSSQI